MLDRIEMDVVRVLLHIPLVTQGVLPKTRLPKSLNANTPAQAMHNALLDQHPAGRKIGVIARQTPDAMQVIGHNHHRQGFKWALRTHKPHHITQCGQCRRLSQPRCTLMGHDGEKVRAPRDVRSTVLHDVLPLVLQGLSHCFYESSSIHFYKSFVGWRLQPQQMHAVHHVGAKATDLQKFITPTGCARNQINLIYPVYNPLIS